MEKDQPEDKYQRFLNWFVQNGGKYSDIVYPTLFPPTNYVGISAKNNIPRLKVIISIPKNIIIGIERVKQSQLNFILEQYPCFQGEDNDDKDFNILTIYLIFQKMKGKQSFFFPYFQCITIAETMVHWSNEQILALDQPFLNLPFMQQVRREFQPTYQIFKEIVGKNKQLFKQQLTQLFFYQCYGITMTRCFGWGLPQTMLVPLADFLNHSSQGVHHYTFSATLEQADHPRYIKKMRDLDLTTMGIDNRQMIPIGFQKDPRQLYLQKNADLLKQIGQPLQTNVQKLSHTDFQTRLKAVRSLKVTQSYENDIIPSSQSQDNDTGQQSQTQEDYDDFGVEAIRYFRTKQFFKQLYNIIQNSKEQAYEPPKPHINRQFDDGVDFSWWYEHKDSHFIVATSRAVDKGEQIFNSYGRRNNRFLLLWYGFTYQGNKYDSIPFRLWSERIEAQTGQLVFTRYITDVDWKQQIALGNQRFPYTYLSNQFRLKKNQINYFLLAYLRYRIIRNSQRFAIFKNNYAQLHKIMDLQLQLQSLKFYKKILIDIIQRFSLAHDRDLTCMKGHRAAFTIILTHSNSDIAYKHCSGVQFMQKVIIDLLNSPSISTLLKIYHQKWPLQEQCNDNQEQVSNRIFLRHYFKLLHNYINTNNQK